MYKIALNALNTEIEPVGQSRQNDDDYVCIRLPRERMAPVDYGLIETVQHQVAHNAGPQNAAPVLHSFPVQLPATASQQSCDDSSTFSYTRVSVLQPGGSGDTNADAVVTEPYLEALTHHGSRTVLVVPGASAAAVMSMC